MRKHKKITQRHAKYYVISSLPSTRNKGSSKVPDPNVFSLVREPGRHTQEEAERGRTVDTTGRQVRVLDRK